MSELILDKFGDFECIGGPLDGKTVRIDLSEIKYQNGPFTYRLTIAPSPLADHPFKYVFIEEKKMAAVKKSLLEEAQ